MFVPPFCPIPGCEAGSDPKPDFYWRFGSYQPKCRPHPVPRFKCRFCLRTFSRQTFRADYWQKKPWLTASIWGRMVSHVSLRQIARTVGVARRTVEHRLVRFGDHAARAHAHALLRLVPAGEFQFDELETYEQNRILKPVTVGVLTHRDSWFVLAQHVGSLRARAGASARSKAAREAHEKVHGRRPNESAKVVKACFSALRPGVGKGELTLVTDLKRTYPVILRQELGEGAVRHVAVSSKLKRDVRNPLFGANHMNAMLRYGLSRLERDTFCGTKVKENLALHLAIHRLWWNLGRKKTNRSKDSPAMALGLYRRRLTYEDLFSWRQVFGPNSIPLPYAELA